jgi:tRNA acetyltransferase TAN1
MFIAKTPRGMEYVAAEHIKERLGDVKIEVRPQGFLGLVLVYSDEIEKVRDIPEIERIVPIVAECRAEIDEIASKAKEVVEKIGEFESFAVKTTRRGKHGFTSIDVNRVFGAKIKEFSQAEVNLDFPEKVFYVEIIGKKAFIGVIDGKGERKKYLPGKTDVRKLLEKISVVQLPYLEAGAKEIGERIGRAVQSFELKELVIAPLGYTSARDLEAFIGGVLKGIEVRFDVQRRIYPREVRKVDVWVQDIYQTARDKRRKNYLLIVTDPTGEEIVKVKDKLKEDLKRVKEIVIFIGSRQGIPKGIFRLADYVIDLAPYITFATELAIPASIIALISVYEESEEEKE